MKARIWCKSCQKWHSRHRAMVCRTGHCPRLNDGKRCKSCESP